MCGSGMVPKVRYHMLQFILNPDQFIFVFHLDQNMRSAWVFDVVPAPFLWAFLFGR